MKLGGSGRDDTDHRRSRLLAARDSLVLRISGIATEKLAKIVDESMSRFQRLGVRLSSNL
jgi:hypothetical protein